MKILPSNFSMISAQKGPKHDEKAHQELKSDLKSKGMKHTETTGHYGYPEKGYMVEHGGSAKEHKTVEELGRKHKQESVLHSKVNKNGTRENTLKYSDKRPDVKGSGHTIDSKATDFYTEHPTIGKFQVGLNFPESKE
jgi:hypothetical protein